MSGGRIWHNENSGCSATGQDYSVIHLQGNLYHGYKEAGAALYQQSSVKFDKWPYKGNYSYSQQNRLLYFIK